MQISHGRILLILSLLPTSLTAHSEGLTKTTIQAVVSANQSETQSCFEVAHAKNPALNGKFRLEIKVGKTGKVEGVKVKDSTFSSAEVETCVENHVRKWAFPSPLEKQKTTFSYPFSFGADLQAAKPGTVGVPLPGSPQTANDAQVYKGRVFKKSNRPIEDPKVFQVMANNTNIKIKGENCENTRILKERCDDQPKEDRIVCSSMIESAPRKPATKDWTLIEHPDGFRIVSGVYFLGYWHVACEHIQKAF